MTFDGGFTQDLTGVLLSHDPDSSDQLHREYFDWVAPVGMSNTVDYVFNFWQDFLILQHDKIFHPRLTNIEIWTDGGPHHFHVSANLWIFAQLQLHYPQVKW